MAMASKTIIHQIYFDDQSKKYLKDFAVPYNNSWHEGKAKQPAFENHIISELIKQDAHKQSNYFGVFSWQFETKNSYWLKNLFDDIEKFPNYDTYTFYKAHTQPNVWRVAEGWHQGIIETSQHIFNRFNGVKITAMNTPTIYQNAHVTKSDIYQDYVETWLDPLMEIMADLEDIWLQEKLFIDTKYKSYRLDTKNLHNVTGVPYYPMHSFICERFFSTYCAVKKIKIKHLC
jgi:hypothetical protein